MDITFGVSGACALLALVSCLAQRWEQSAVITRLWQFASIALTSCSAVSSGLARSFSIFWAKMSTFSSSTKCRFNRASPPGEPR